MSSGVRMKSDYKIHPLCCCSGHTVCSDNQLGARTKRCVFVIHFIIIESVDSISKDERGFPLTQYITNGRISRGGYTFTHFKHHHRVLRLISYRMGV